VNPVVQGFAGCLQHLVFNWLQPNICNQRVGGAYRPVRPRDVVLQIFLFYSNIIEGILSSLQKTFSPTCGKLLAQYLDSSSFFHASGANSSAAGQYQLSSSIAWAMETAFSVWPKVKNNLGEKHIRFLLTRIDEHNQNPQEKIEMRMVVTVADMKHRIRASLNMTVVSGDGSQCLAVRLNDCARTE